MKNLIYSKIFLLCIFLIVSCEPNYQDLVTENAATGGLVNVNTPSLNYIIGNDATYTVSLQVLQGEVKTTSVNVWKSFTSSEGETSNQALLKEVNVTSDVTSALEFTVDLEELRSGLSIDGVDLPADDGLYSIGDSWTLTFQTVTSEGNVHLNRSTVKISVATRLAGMYEVIASSYFRIGVDNGGWNGDIRFIESVNPTTYYHSGYGPFTLDQSPASFFYFSVDDANTVSYFQEYNGAVITGLGTNLITCQTNPNDMVNVDCDPATTNYVLLNDETGEDIIYMTYGYYTDGSGPREFYEVLQKVVN